MQKPFGRKKDEELFRLLSSAEERDDAFTELYSRYAQKIYMYTLRMTGNADEAGDIFQDTFIRFINRDASYDPVANVSAYLYTTARNIFLNRRRDERHTVPLVGDDLPDYVPSYEREELFNMVSSSLDLLDVPYREAFVLRFYQGLSYREMSAITGDSISALKVRVMRAKDQIRSILSPYIADLSR